MATRSINNKILFTVKIVGKRFLIELSKQDGFIAVYVSDKKEDLKLLFNDDNNEGLIIQLYKAYDAISEYLERDYRAV